MIPLLCLSLAYPDLVQLSSSLQIWIIAIQAMSFERARLGSTSRQVLEIHLPNLYPPAVPPMPPVQAPPSAPPPPPLVPYRLSMPISAPTSLTIQNAYKAQSTLKIILPPSSHWSTPPAPSLPRLGLQPTSPYSQLAAPDFSLFNRSQHVVSQSSSSHHLPSHGTSSLPPFPSTTSSCSLQASQTPAPTAMPQQSPRLVSPSGGIF